MGTNTPGSTPNAIERMNDPSYWAKIVEEGDGDTLAQEAQMFLQQIEKNVPNAIRSGFNALETVLLDVARHAPAEVIRSSSKQLVG